MLKWDHQKQSDDLFKATERSHDLEAQLTEVHQLRDSLLSEKSRLEVLLYDESEQRQTAESRGTQLEEEKASLLEKKKQQTKKIRDLEHSTVAATKKSSHNCIDHNYVGHNYVGHNYIGRRNEEIEQAAEVIG